MVGVVSSIPTEGNFIFLLKLLKPLDVNTEMSEMPDL